MEDRKETYSNEKLNGRWKKYTIEEINKDASLNLAFKWIQTDDDEEKTVGAYLKEVETVSGELNDSLLKLKDLLKGVLDD